MASPFSQTPPVRSVLQPNPNPNPPRRTFLALRGTLRSAPSSSRSSSFHRRDAPPHVLQSRRIEADSYRGWSDGSGRRSCCSAAAACSLRSAASYASIRSGAAAARLCRERRVKPGRLLQKRAGVVTCATTEEIEAEKSMIEKDVKQRMEKTIETVRSKFNSVRTGRANPAMLDKVEVEYYGSPVSLKSIAQISTPEASAFLIQPYDKSSLKAIEKAIVSSDLGMTPNNDGEVIRLSLPQLTTERRKELSKIVAKQAEEGKVALRNIRRDALKAYEKLEKEKKLSEDNVKDLSSDLQKLTDDYMKKIDTIYKQKEKELLTV